MAAPIPDERCLVCLIKLILSCEKHSRLSTETSNRHLQLTEPHRNTLISAVHKSILLGSGLGLGSKGGGKQTINLAF